MNTSRFRFHFNLKIIRRLIILAFISALVIICLGKKKYVSFRRNQKKLDSGYRPGNTEMYVYQNSRSLGYDTMDGEFSKGCSLWVNHSQTIYQNYLTELEDYNRRVREFQTKPDIRKRLRRESRRKLCRELELHPRGLAGIFKSGGLSQSIFNGGIEPLLPPLRHPNFCFDERELMRLDYLVHDFEAICNRISESSRIVLIDLGASLEFHDAGKAEPIYFITDLYRKFGLRFDHIYAYEKEHLNVKKVFDALPDELFASYHWINMGVSANMSEKTNPLRMILENFIEEDLVILKLDVDSPMVELGLIEEILGNNRLCRLIDHLYFEHHVHLEELSPYWSAGSMKGSVRDSLKLFRELREKGIAAHYWV